MSQSTNPAWQGATQVANVRLRTIDQAVSRLEALVPDDSAPPPPQPESQPDSQPSQSVQKFADKVTSDTPAPVPTPSLQALETFMESTYQKRYMPKAV